MENKELSFGGAIIALILFFLFWFIYGVYIKPNKETKKPLYYQEMDGDIDSNAVRQYLP